MEVSAKIVTIDSSNLEPKEPSDWNGTSELTFYVDVECEGKKYQRKLTFRIHDQKIYNIGETLTKEDVERAILAEVDQITSLHSLCSCMQSEIGVCQVAKLTAENV